MAVGWDLPAESHQADVTHHTRSASTDVPGFYKLGQGWLSSVKVGETEAWKVSLGQTQSQAGLCCFLSPQGP